MRKLLFSISLLALVTACGARAGKPPLPDQMPVGDAAQLDRAIAHIKEINEQANKAAKQWVDEIDGVLGRNQISQQDFAQGRVTVDFTTGKITRRPAPSPAPAPVKK